MQLAHLTQTIDLSVIGGDGVVCTLGANAGDGFDCADALVLGDIYERASSASKQHLSLIADHGVGFRICATSPIGAKGGRVYLDSVASLMSDLGQVHEIVAFVEVDDWDNVNAVYLWPITHLPRAGIYTLMEIDTTTARTRFAKLGHVALPRGTQITLGTGRQRAVEQLSIGDSVLTRDHGAQKVQQIGRDTMRATGFSKGGPGKPAKDRDRTRTGHAIGMFKTRNPASGDVVPDGGFVDCFQVLFDRPEIIYANGNPVKNMHFDARVRPVVSANIHHLCQRPTSASRATDFSSAAAPIGLPARMEAPQNATAR